MNFSPPVSSAGAPTALRSESVKPLFPFAECASEQGDCAVDVPTCEREPLTQEKVSLARVGSAFKTEPCQARLTWFVVH